MEVREVEVRDVNVVSQEATTEVNEAQTGTSSEKARAQKALASFGKRTDLSNTVASLMNKYDVNHDGKFSVDEVKGIVEDFDATTKKQKKTKRNMKRAVWIALAFAAFLAVSLAANFAVIFSVVDAQMKTTTGPLGQLQVKGSDAIVKTAKAEVYVPLIVAPVLDLQTLEAVDVLTVKIKMNTPSMMPLALSPSTAEEDQVSDLPTNLTEWNITTITWNTTASDVLEESDDAEQEITRKYTITGFDWESRTRVTFVTSRGDMVHIRDGIAYVVTPAGVQHPVCAALASCSAFKTGGFNVSAKLNEAMQALGLTRGLNATTAIATSARHRRLNHVCESWNQESYCDEYKQTCKRDCSPCGWRCETCTNKWGVKSTCNCGNKEFIQFHPEGRESFQQAGGTGGWKEECAQVGSGHRL